MRRSVAIGLLLLATLFAGCSDEPSTAGTAEPEPEAFKEVQVTSTTGAIRGIVVTQAIVPLQNVTVSLTDGRNQTTDAEGAFVFNDLEPGDYFVSASKLGYVSQQAAATVVAGDPSPPITKIILQADPAARAPYYEQFVLQGYIQCGTTTSVVAVAVCSIPNGCLGLCGDTAFTEDVFGMFVPVLEVPMHIQHEVIWDATQNTGDMLSLAMRTATQEQYDGGSYDRDIGGDVIGTSPLLGIINQTMILDERNEIGVNGTGLAPAVFSGGMEGTNPPCVPVPETPATNPGNLCGFATGAAINQKFEMYTHVFYGYTPPEGWRFSDASSVPEPPQ
jgi:hypothetical protein